MTISLKEVKTARELRADGVSPVVANVKYAQRNDQDVSPVVANAKYAQRQAA